MATIYSICRDVSDAILASCTGRRKHYAPAYGHLHVTPMMETCFEDVYPSLESLADEAQPGVARLHAGMAGFRNLSSVAAGRLDGAILFDKSTTLVGDKKWHGPGFWEAAARIILQSDGPEDFIERLIADVNRDQYLLMETQLRAELYDHTSFLFLYAEDGRFEYIQELFRQQRIGYVGVDACDPKGMAMIKEGVDRIRREVPGFEQAFIASMYTANVAPYTKEKKDYFNEANTPDSFLSYWNNIFNLGPDAYLTCAEFRPRELSQDDPLFSDRAFCGPSIEKVWPFGEVDPDLEYYWVSQGSPLIKAMLQSLEKSGLGLDDLNDYRKKHREPAIVLTPLVEQGQDERRRC